MIESENLEEKIATINNVLDVKEIINLHPNKEYIARYYYLNKIPYSIFHTNTNLVHMGLSKDGIYKEDDLLESPRIVQSYIERNDAHNVLELATGRGANSVYLAKRFPDSNFHGIDLSPGQLSYAKTKAKQLVNYFPQQGDYHDLSRYEAESFDIVFEVEAVCYSLEKEKVLEEVSRVLRKGGLFILFDAYRGREPLSEIEDTAMGLVEKGMALQVFEQFSSFKEKTSTSNFEIIRDEDLSEYILPTLYRFERLARRFFKHKYLAKIIKYILPKEIVYNSAAGYLMPIAVNSGLFTYHLTVLQKK